MHASLSALAALPPDTRVYCGHEYTTANLRFAAHVEPSNKAVAQAASDATRERDAGKPTVPGTIARELETNPFLRASLPEIRRTLGTPEDADAVTAFAAARKAKDDFKG
jgi:hydroxyacylglutathione hydrolase